MAKSILTPLNLKTEIETYYDKVSVVAISDSIRQRLYEMADKMADEIIEQLEVKNAFRESVKVDGKRSYLITLVVGQKGRNGNE